MTQSTENHPTDDVLTEFLYDELSPARAAEVAEHVAACEQCRSQVVAWRGVRSDLEAWALDAPATTTRRGPREGPWAPLKWAAAAAVLLCAGYAFARLTAPPRVDEAQIVRTVRAELKQDMDTQLARYDAASRSRQDEANQGLERALGVVDARHATDIAALRQSLETVALNTNFRFRQLASAGPADAPPTPNSQ